MKTSTITLTNKEKGQIWMLIDKYDGFIKAGFPEYKDFVAGLSAVLQGIETDSDLMKITQFMDWDEIGELDFKTLDITVGTAIDEMFLAMDYELV